MTALSSLDVALASLRAGDSYLDVDPVALEAIIQGNISDPKLRQGVFYTDDAQDDTGQVTPIIDSRKTQRIVFCVALQPNVPDTFGSVMTAESIEYTAHRFMMASRVIKASHLDEIRAYPVESYIAPVDIAFESGMYGPQEVKQGSWVLGIKVLDDAIWQMIVAGEYTGISVGGFSLQGEL